VIDLLFNIDVLFAMDIREGKKCSVFFKLHSSKALRKAIIIVKNSLHRRYIREVTHIATEILSKILSLNLFAFVNFQPQFIWFDWWFTTRLYLFCRVSLLNNLVECINIYFYIIYFILYLKQKINKFNFIFEFSSLIKLFWEICS